MKLQQCPQPGDIAPAWKHWCPGCGWMHVIYTDRRSQPNGHFWRFNGDLERPTFEPSVHLVGQCHYFITDGKIVYCKDSKHKLAGKTIDLPDLSEAGEDWDES